MTLPTQEAIEAALERVIDPEIRRPVTQLGMVRSIDIADDGAVTIGLNLTVAGCPLKDTLTADTQREVGAVAGVTSVKVELGVMNDEERAALRTKLRGGVAEPEIPFTKPGNLTRVYAVTSGKGGVGKSSVTANLAAAMAAQGLSVGVVDADIYGFSIPRMLGVDHVPTQLDGMIVLHRAVQQFLTDVFWGDLDVLLLDLPPGTGDVTISVAQLLPNAEILVVTTPQAAAAEVAERTGLIASQTKQKVVGVIENMSYIEQPDGTILEIFGSGGGAQVAANLSRELGYEVPVLAQLPLDINVREGSDCGVPASIADDGRPAAGSSAAQGLAGVARKLGHRARGLAGRSLGVSPV